MRYINDCIAFSKFSPLITFNVNFTGPGHFFTGLTAFPLASGLGPAAKVTHCKKVKGSQSHQRVYTYGGQLVEREQTCIKPKLSNHVYTPYEGLISTNQNDRKLDVYDRKLQGSHSTQG